MSNKKCVLPLTEINIGECCCVFDINDECAVKRRLSDMGIVKNRDITPVYNSPFGTPRAYLVCGTLVALRNADARHIMVLRHDR